VTRSPVSRAGVAATIAAALAIIAGLFTLGTPSHARERRLDELRMEDLARLSHAVDVYWTKHAALPQSLESLVSERQFDRVLTDPKTDSAYTYLPSGERSYRLCATFAQPMDSTTPRGYVDGVDIGERSWRHGAGESCFDLTVPVKETK
jgi:hypothetical protein